MNIKITNDIKTYYINLDKSVDRNENMKELLHKYNFTNFERIQAVATPNIEEVDKYREHIDDTAYETLVKNNRRSLRSNHQELTNGAVGCFLSHMKIYQDMIKNKVPYAIIFEDDIEINSSSNYFWKTLGEIEVPSNADIILINCIPHEFIEINNKDLRKTNFFYGLSFYMITLAGAQKALDNLLPITEQIDFKLSRLSYLGKLEIYYYYKDDLKVASNKKGTTIQSMMCLFCNIQREIAEVKNKNNIKYDKVVRTYSNTDFLTVFFIMSIIVFIFWRIKKEVI